MKKLAAVVLVFGVVLMWAQTRPATDRPFRIERLDPALDAIIAPDSKLETLGEHFGLTEGPVRVPEGRRGYLLFSDCAGQRHLSVDARRRAFGVP